MSRGKGVFELDPPQSALDRKDDLEEVERMIESAEYEIARDELLYLVSDCTGFVAAHFLLGHLALEENNISLARGHFGFGYECALDVVPEDFRGKLPSSFPGNEPFFKAGQGLARCLISLKQPRKGRNVLRQLLDFDPDYEPAKQLLEELEAKMASGEFEASSTMTAQDASTVDTPVDSPLPVVESPVVESAVDESPVDAEDSTD